MDLGPGYHTAHGTRLAASKRNTTHVCPHRLPFPPFFFDFPPLAAPASAFPVAVAAVVAISSTGAGAGASVISTSPPAVAAAAPAVAAAAATAAAEPDAVVVVVPRSEIFAPLASFPRPVISRPTSAALFVRYLRHTPVEGLYVFKVRVAIGCCCCCCCCCWEEGSEVSAEGSVVALDLDFCWDTFDVGVRDGKLYLVVILV